MGHFDFVLNSFSRFSENLAALVPQSAAQVGGYIKVESDQPIVTQEIFVKTAEIYVAVPPSK